MLSLGLRDRHRVVRSRDGSLTLWNCRYQQCYKSTAGAVAESRHVYLEASGVAERLRQGQATRILEIGLGTGLNFLLTSKLALRHRTAIEYVALEQSPVPRELLQSLGYGAVVSHTPFYNAWLKSYGRQCVVRPGALWNFRFPPFIAMQMHLGDALQTITEVATVNAIYLDAFSPDQNSELWSAPFIGRLAERLEPGGRLTTYCVQRKVRERLSSAGLKVEKMRGPNGGKREILVAEQPYSR